MEFLETGEGVLAAQTIDRGEIDAEGATFPARARALCSRRGPVREAEQIAATIDFKQTAAIAMAGFGVGHLAGVIAKRMKRSGVIVIFEPDLGLLRAVLERIDHSGWIGESNVVLLTDGDDAASMSAALTGVEGIVMMGLALVEHPACGQRLGAAKGKFYAKFQQVVQAVRTMVATTLVQVETTVRNLVSNVGYYAGGSGIEDLAGAAAGRHAIVVSAGPSLERNIDELTRPGVREQFVIVAAQTVLKPLLRRGIKPHFVTALDHSDISARFYEGLTAADVEGVTLIIEPKASPAIPRAFPGVIRCVHDRFLDAMLGDSLGPTGSKAPLPAGATVAHLAYYLARHLGCDPVVLIGQDLGFTDGQYYPAGATIHDVWACELNEFNTLEMMEWSRVKRMGKHLRPMIGVNGEPIYTDEQMSTYLVQFERDFAKDAAQGLSVIDATEGGVRKAHTRVEPLRGVIDRVLARHDAPHGVSVARQATGVACPPETVLERLDLVRSGVRRVAAICGDTGAMLGEMLEHHADQERVNRLIGAVDAQRRQIEACDPAYRLVHFLNQAGAFQRIRSDRAIHLDPDLTPLERQRLAIERDMTNVGGLAASAGKLDVILRDAAKAFEHESSLDPPELDVDETEADGEACAFGINSRNCFSTIDDMDDEPGEAGPAPASAAASTANGTGHVGIVSASASVWAVVPLNLSEGVTGMKYRPALESIGAELVIQRTLARLSCIRHIQGIILLTNRVAEAQRLADGSSRRKPIAIHAVDEFRSTTLRERLRAARAWARTCWRGGLGGSTCYDEVFHPHATLEALRQVGGSAALLTGPDWCFIDPRLCDQVIERHVQEPLSRRLTFSLAPPGLAGCVIERTLVGSLQGVSGDGRWIAPIGRVLSYMPSSPTVDPTGTPACVGVSPRVRDSGLRFIADSEVTRGRLERMWQGLAGMFMEPTSDYIAEAMRIEAERNPDTVPDEVYARCEQGADPTWVHWVIESLASGGVGRAITIHAGGLADGRIADIVHHAKERRVNVHVRMPASALIGRLRTVLVAGPDVLSLEFVDPGTPGGPDGSGVLQQVHAAGAGASEILKESLEGLKVDTSASATWIVPRLVRSDATREVIEPFFDRWISEAGAAVLDPLDHAAATSGGRIRGLPLPASYRRRLARSRLCILPSGDALVDPTHSGAAGTLGNLLTRSLEECWALAQKRRREEGWYV